MPTFQISVSAFTFHFLLVLLPILRLVSGASNETLTTANPNFDPQIALLGDATIFDNGSRIQLANPHPSSSGLLLYRNPSGFLSSSAVQMPSFSSEFEFSLTGNGVGLSFIMGPFNFASEYLGLRPIGFSNEKGFVGIEFIPSMDNNVADSNSDFVSVIVNNTGEKMKSWIDYDSSSKRLEVRVGKLGDRRRSYDPIIANLIDLSKMWQNKEVYVGLGSRNGVNTSETCNVYSLKFRLRKLPNRMHSMPVDPNLYKAESVNENLKVHRKKMCPLTVLAGMIFATGCGALMAFVVLFVWAISVNRRTVFPVEGDMKPGFKYEKIHIIVDQDEKVLKN